MVKLFYIKHRIELSHEKKLFTHRRLTSKTVKEMPDDPAEMVAAINMDQVSIDERISNQVYHYDKNLRTIRLTTDTPNKRRYEDMSIVDEKGKCSHFSIYFFSGTSSICNCRYVIE